jgi:hypothetical protein
VDTNLERVGYSSIGPAYLADKKPDICGYTHFTGSGALGPVDAGTSAATPVVAGVVAAVRTKRPYSAGNPEASPAAIRSLMTSTAMDLSPSGWDYATGYGVVDGHALRLKFCATFPQKCVAHPWLCWDICKQFPWVCKGISEWPEIPGPGPVEQVPDVLNPKLISSIKRLARLSGITDPLELAAVMSLLLTTRTPAPVMPAQSVAKEGSKLGDCGCGGKH